MYKVYKINGTSHSTINYLRSDIALTVSAGEADFLGVHIATVIDYYSLNTQQVVALVTPSRQPFKSVQDRRVNSGNLGRSLHSDLSKKSLLKRKQRLKRLSAPVNTLHQLIPRLVRSTEATSPIQEKSLECDKVLPLKCNDEECTKDFAENVVGGILTEVHKV